VESFFHFFKVIPSIEAGKFRWSSSLSTSLKKDSKFHSTRQTILMMPEHSLSKKEETLLNILTLLNLSLVIKSGSNSNLWQQLPTTRSTQKASQSASPQSVASWVLLSSVRSWSGFTIISSIMLLNTWLTRLKKTWTDNVSTKRKMKLMKSSHQANITFWFNRKKTKRMSCFLEPLMKRRERIKQLKMTQVHKMKISKRLNQGWEQIKFSASKTSFRFMSINKDF
jgi:hypothetical protein